MAKNSCGVMVSFSLCKESYLTIAISLALTV